ncbi:MAG: VTT domain-containing protein [Proteobacteria bacterium]|nr:VTT domain-containing protein [Cystobacterineae bacterium]MCL2258984.1 VTT domain-containing protein [Cystobacterineae bacterium]MCL2314670.1 VTT domain-containing protein [Pseudomonadota bacterium]
MWTWVVSAFEQVVQWLREPGELIAWGGYPGLALVIFAETGALVFFLPGDSLLVTAGLYAAKGDLSIWVLNFLLAPMAILGDAISYSIGLRGGSKLFQNPNARFLKPRYLEAAHAFYEKHGGKAIVLARFMPLVRTFVPVVAGMAKMPYRRFATYNIMGGIGWIASMTLLGFFLGNAVPSIDKHIEKLIVLVVFVSISPGLWAALKQWLNKRRTS